VPLRLALKTGAFELNADIATPAGKAVHVEKNNGGFVVRGALFKDTIEPNMVNDLELQGAGQ